MSSDDDGGADDDGDGADDDLNMTMMTRLKLYHDDDDDDDDDDGGDGSDGEDGDKCEGSNVSGSLMNDRRRSC